MHIGPKMEKSQTSRKVENWEILLENERTQRKRKRDSIGTGKLEIEKISETLLKFEE